jgi:hypothetical protein
MQVKVGILNESHVAREEFIMEQCSGITDDHSNEVLAHLADVDEAHECQSGHWVTIVDGEVIAQNTEFHPFRIHCQ